MVAAFCSSAGKQTGDSAPKGAFSYTRSKSKSSFRIGPLFLAIPVASFGLGVWQTYRLRWKQGMIEELDYQGKMEPISITERSV